MSDRPSNVVSALRDWQTGGFLGSEMAGDAADEINRLTKREAELVGLLRECRKVMKADSLHRGNPDRRQLATRISAALKEQT